MVWTLIQEYFYTFFRDLIFWGVVSMLVAALFLTVTMVFKSVNET